MVSKITRRYCASPEVVRLMQRDGIGWGHDLDCGCLEMNRLPRRAGPVTTLLNRLKGGRP